MVKFQSILSVLFSLALASGCSQKTTSSGGPNWQYPHPNNWIAEHMINGVPVAANPGPNAPNDEHHVKEENSTNCSICHDAMKLVKSTAVKTTCNIGCHGPETPVGGGPLQPIPAPIANKCQACHENKFDDSLEYRHAPSGAGLCVLCHVASDDHIAGSDKKGVTTDSNVSTCYKCHERRFDKKPFVHGALEYYDDSCIRCHNPHGSDRRPFLRKESNFALCMGCHDSDIPVGGKSIHGVIKEGEGCLNCHTPHSGDYDKLLLTAEAGVCFSCHDKEITTKDRIIPNIKAKLDGPFVHTGAAYNECTGCHENIHASKNERLLNENYSTKNYNLYKDPANPNRPNPYAFCLQCHDEDEKLGKTGYDTGFRDPLYPTKHEKKNLHWFHVVDAAGNKDKARGRGCRICHDPHGANQMFNINDSWDMSNTALLAAMDSEDAKIPLELNPQSTMENPLEHPLYRIPIVYTPTFTTTGAVVIVKRQNGTKEYYTGGNCTKTCHGKRDYDRIP